MAWWRHQMETFSALLAHCVGNSQVSGEFPAQRPVTRSFDVFFDLHLIKRLSKHSRGWWLETLWRPLWRHCNGNLKFCGLHSVWDHSWKTLYCHIWLSLPNIKVGVIILWWRHQMETVSALLALCAGNSPVTGEFPSKRPVTRSFDVFFDLRLNKRLSKQSRRRWFETPSRSLWRHCKVTR